VTKLAVGEPCRTFVLRGDVCHGRVQTCRPMGACVVGVGAEPAQHVYRLTWGGDLWASPVLEPIQLGLGSAHSSIAWGSRDRQVWT